MEEFKSKRKSIKCSITRIFTYCNSNEASAEGILARMSRLDDYYKQFENIQDAIDKLVQTNEEIKAEEEYRSHIENTYYQIKEINIKVNTKNDNSENNSINNSVQNNQQIVTLIDTIATNQTTLNNLVQTISSNQPSSSTPIISHQNQVQLPRISLPTFNGSCTKWIHFRDLFTALIHDNNNLSDIEKFEYLQSHIDGDALSMIKHLNLSNSNYIVAWDLINKKFNDSKQLKREYLKLLFDQPIMKGPFIPELKRLVNNCNEAINALKSLDEELDKWNSILLFHLERKLDNESQSLWLRSSPDSPSHEHFLEFIEKRLRELESQQPNKPTSFQQNSNKQRFQQINITEVKNCPSCQQQHPLFLCNKFKALNIQDRIKLVKNNKICYNCLSYDHYSSQCSKSTCKLCKGKHNTLLHLQKQNKETDSTIVQTNINSVYTDNSTKVTLLPTAVALILGSDNNYHSCRILLDTGAQTTIISEACVQRLKLKKSYDKTLLCGIGNDNKNYTRGKVQIVLKSKISDMNINTTALCLAKLTNLQPSIPITTNQLEYFRNLPLADPNCTSPSHIDLILGANVFNEWYLNQQIVHPSGTLSALYTLFGWVLVGEVETTQKQKITVAHTSVDISDQLQNFWKLEEVNECDHSLSKEEQMAEDFYKNTVQREDSGRYIVRLPFKNSRPTFSNTYHQASKRLFNMENKFIKNYQLCADYKHFMQEYVNIDHMEILKNKEDAKYYLPHHSVTKVDSTTTKLRVVFDGSAKDQNNKSLNDELLVGPTIQKDIFEILTQFRKFQFAITADIEKMYRQILIHPHDRPYQCVLWRQNQNEQIISYQLKTVTYGTSAAPFLAMRTLKQVAIDLQKNNSNIADIINNCFYVDDLMFSSTNELIVIQSIKQLNKVLYDAGFHLRKWSANSVKVLETIDKQDQELSNQTIINDNQTVKTLGLYWDTSLDVFKYNVAATESVSKITKRTVLSKLSKIYDPLGWLSPVIITFKVFMQKLWLCGLEWDSLLPEPLQEEWQQIYNNINDIKKLNIPRWLNFSNKLQVQLHGFADSSELAYAAVVYLKVINTDGSIFISLLASKTRVAPVKQITIPRLELCACHLLTKLFIKVKNALQIQNIEVHGWTDSKIVLCWLSAHPRKWKNFIANRTSYIINILPAQHWHHISSVHNPADLATRGLTPLQLKNSNIWWNGPLELQESTYNKPILQLNNQLELESRKNTILHVNNSQQNDLFNLYSNFSKLLRITATILRFINNCKSIKKQRQTGFLTTNELVNSHNILVKRSQNLTYKVEISIISAQKQLPNNHHLLSLNPFIDDHGILRVGGRLINANISFNQKHPFILHKESKLTQLIIHHYHIKYLHAGPRQLQYLLSLKYWIPSAVHIIKNCIYKCTICLRHRSQPFKQQMGNLPKHRLQATTAFQNVGVDFAGPFSVRSWKGRGQKQYKSWIAVFICLTIKAIHLEVVTELSTAAFLAALRRFVARRGKPLNMYSDNGTNFVGCNQKLKEFIHFMLTSSTQEAIAKKTSNLGIQWHFSPPYGPNFGGIWEAGVKSLKYHLYRVLGYASVTYEELNTVVCQIESCLNSRPLVAKFQGDIDPLTPAHFLIMKAMDSVPDQDVANVKINRLTRWQLLQQIVQHFWKQWSSNYLTQLQNRPKWKNKMQNLQINDVVLIKNDQAPPCKWTI